MFTPVIIILILPKTRPIPNNLPSHSSNDWGNNHNHNLLYIFDNAYPIETFSKELLNTGHLYHLTLKWTLK